MHFDTTLNLAWVLLGLLALGSTIHAEFRTESKLSQSRWLHIVGVGLIIAALFPYISATDDILRIERFSSQLEQDQVNQHEKGPAHQAPQKAGDDLMRLYETMDSPLVVRFCEFGLIFLFITLVIVFAVREIQRSAVLRAGRSPPVFVL